MFKLIVNIRPLNDAREFPKSAAGQIIYSSLSVSAYRTCVNPRGTGKREGPTRQGVMKVPCFSLKWPPNRQGVVELREKKNSGLLSTTWLVVRFLSLGQYLSQSWEVKGQIFAKSTNFRLTSVYLKNYKLWWHKTFVPGMCHSQKSGSRIRRIRWQN